jgi:hypothetical protein
MKLADKMTKGWREREEVKAQHKIAERGWAAAAAAAATPPAPPASPVIYSGLPFTTSAGSTVSGTWSTSGTTSVPFTSPLTLGGSTVFSSGFTWTPLANDPSVLMIRIEDAIERYMRGDQDKSDQVMLSRADWLLLAEAMRHLYREGWRLPEGGLMTYTRWGYIFGFTSMIDWPDSMPVLVHHA